MDVELLYVEDCPNVALARERLREAVQQVGLGARVREQLVRDEAEAVRLGMRGSPTVRIGGADIAPDGEVEGSMSCRLYRDGGQPAGAPSTDELVAALRRRQEGGGRDADRR